MRRPGTWESQVSRLRVLVIGGTNLIGPHLVPMLLQAGHEVTVMTRGNSVLPFLAEVEHVRAERGAGLLELRGRSFDATVDNLCYEPEHVRQVVAALGEGVGHYVMTSTVFVGEPVGRPRAVLSEDDADLEGIPTGYPDDPHACHVYGKRRCELLLRTTYRSLCWTIIRPVNVFGPPDPQHRLRWWVARATDGSPIALPDDFPAPSGERNNLMVFSGDVASAQLASLGSPTAVGRTYLLAMDEALSIPELVRAIAGAAGLTPPVLIRIPRPILDRTPLGDNPAGTFRVPLLWPGVRISNKRAKEDLGWCPTPLGDWLPTVVGAILAEARESGWPRQVAYGNRSLEVQAARIWLDAQGRSGRELVEQTGR